MPQTDDIDLSAGIKPKAPSSGGDDIDLSAGIKPKVAPAVAAPATKTSENPNLWQRANTPMFSNTEIFKRNRAIQDFEQGKPITPEQQKYITPEIRKKYESSAERDLLDEHGNPKSAVRSLFTATGMRNYIAGVDERATDLLTTPLSVATSALDAGVSRGTQALEAYAPEIYAGLGRLATYVNGLRVAKAVAPVAKTAVPAANAAYGASTLWDAATSDNMDSDDRMRTVLGGLSMLAGGAAGAAHKVSGAEHVSEVPTKTKEALKESVKDVTRNQLRKMGGVNNSVARDLVRKTIADNESEVEGAKKATADKQAAADKKYEKDVDSHREKTEEAVHANRGIDLLNKEERAAAERKAEEDHAKAVAKIDEDHAKATAAHEREAKRIQQENDRKRRLHDRHVELVKRSNAATEEQLALRQRTEQELDSATKEHFDEIEKTRAQAEADNRSRWSKFWDKAGRQTPVDVIPVVEAVKALDGPDRAEIKQVVSNITPRMDEETLSLADSNPQVEEYLSTRDNVVKYFSFGKNFSELSPFQKETVINFMNNSHIYPPTEAPIDLDATGEVSLQRLHNVKTELGYRMKNFEYSETARQNMRKVYNALSKVEMDAAKQAGAEGDLIEARESHQKKEAAFGKVPRERTTQTDLLKEDANAKAVREREEQERLEAASEYNPNLEKSAKRLKELQERLNSIPKENSLRGKLKTAKDAPILKPIPEPPARPPNPDKPEVVYPRGVNRMEIPDRPEKEKIEPVNPEVIQRDLEDLKKANVAAMEKTAKGFRESEGRVATAFATLGGITAVLTGHFAGAALVAVSRIAYGALKDRKATYLEDPAVQEWMKQPTKGQLAEFRNLPPEYRKPMIESLDTAVKAAEAKGYPVSKQLKLFLIAQQSANAGQNKDKRKSTELYSRGISPQ